MTTVGNPRQNHAKIFELRISALTTFRGLIATLSVAAMTVLNQIPVVAQPLSTSACLSEWQRFDAAQQSGLHALLLKHRANPGGASLSEPDLQRLKSYLQLMETIKFRCRDFVPPPPGVTAQ